MAIKKRERSIRACYERATRNNPDVHGKITIEFSVRSRGPRLRTKVLQNSTGSDRIARCVVRRLNALKLSASKHGGADRMSYPFVFSGAGRP